MTQKITSSQELFLRANKLYGQGQYEQALKIYNQIDDKGTATWFNMGKTASVLKQFVDARVFLNRALKNATPGQAQRIRQELSVLESNDGMTTQTYTVGSYLLPYIQAVPFFLHQSVVLFFWIAICWSIARCGVRKKPFLVALLCGMLVVSGLLLWYRYSIAWNPVGIVTSEQVALYAGPDSGYHTVGAVDILETVRIVGANGQWYKVAYGDTCGWITQEQVSII